MQQDQKAKMQPDTTMDHACNLQNVNTTLRKPSFLTGAGNQQKTDGTKPCNVKQEETQWKSTRSRQKRYRSPQDSKIQIEGPEKLPETIIRQRGRTSTDKQIRNGKKDQSPNRYSARVDLTTQFGCIQHLQWSRHLLHGVDDLLDNGTWRDNIPQPH